MKEIGVMVTPGFKRVTKRLSELLIHRESQLSPGWFSLLISPDIDNLGSKKTLLLRGQNESEQFFNQPLRKQ